ncbi:hypothetical protein AB0A77_06470 [Streptomyces varsoviensis]|uniref:hypothetical protein n=1 Tax=Streptomyces varsoviensis TaxID=67373 RepID=UPI00340A3CD5
MDALLTRYPPELLDRFDEFLREMCAALNAHITEVSQASQASQEERPGRGG